MTNKNGLNKVLNVIEERRSTVKNRINKLQLKEQLEGLTVDEKAELDRYEGEWCGLTYVWSKTLDELHK